MKKNAMCVCNEIVPQAGGQLVVGNAVDLIDIRPLIYEIRGVPVMLDRDLASIYRVMTGRLNEAVKRNCERFPKEFMFQLSDSEMAELIANCDRFKKMKHSPSRMYAFTEQGVAMLSAVLRSDIAIRESIRIMNAFVAMRKTLAVVGPAFEKLAARVEANERRQIVDQERNELQFKKIHERMSEGEVPDHQLFYQGQFWDAKSLLIKFVRRAKKDVILVDAYIGVATLDILAKRNRGVRIEIITHSNGDLTETDFTAFGRQYGKLTKTLSGISHDRYLIVDGKELYTFGASIKDAGRLTFSVIKLGPEAIQGLLENLRGAATGSQLYN